MVQTFGSKALSQWNRNIYAPKNSRKQTITYLVASPELGNIVLNHSDDNVLNGVIAIDANPSELENKEIKVRIGSILDFSRFEIPYSNQISSLRVNILYSASGKPVIRIKSIRPVDLGRMPLVVKLDLGQETIFGAYDLEMLTGYQGLAKNLLNSSNVRLYASSNPLRNGDSIKTGAAGTSTGKQPTQKTNNNKSSHPPVQELAKHNSYKTESSIKDPPENKMSFNKLSRGGGAALPYVYATTLVK